MHAINKARVKYTNMFKKMSVNKIRAIFTTEMNTNVRKISHSDVLSYRSFRVIYFTGKQYTLSKHYKIITLSNFFKSVCAN